MHRPSVHLHVHQCCTALCSTAARRSAAQLSSRLHSHAMYLVANTVRLFSQTSRSHPVAFHSDSLGQNTPRLHDVGVSMYWSEQGVMQIWSGHQHLAAGVMSAVAVGSLSVNSYNGGVCVRSWPSTMCCPHTSDNNLATPPSRQLTLLLSLA